MLSVLSHIQRRLTCLYRLEPNIQVEHFVIPRSEVSGALDRPEQVLVKTDGDALEMALVLEDGLFARSRPAATQEGAAPLALDAFCALAEGVSHVLYLAATFERAAKVSQLELELQAELDKFTLLLFAGMKASRLIHRLFGTFELRSDVSAGSERDRYLTANRMARHFCRGLVARCLRHGRRDAALNELRGVYRLRGTRKLDAVASGYRL